MHKVFLGLSLLVSSFNTSSIIETKVESIEYNANSYLKDYIELKIVISSTFEDIIEMKVNFNDNKNEKDDIYYSSSLNVKGRISTIAKIPFMLDEKVFLNISFYSNNAKDKLVDVLFPVYPIEETICNLSKSYHCSSGLPVNVLYKNNVISENYEKITLINRDLTHYSFDNSFPFKSIKISSTRLDLRGEAILYVLDRIDDFYLSYDTSYVFPLEIEYKNGIISFFLINKYYLNLLEGKMYETYKAGTIYDNKIIFPYSNNKYKILIELSNCFSSFSKVLVECEFMAIKKLYGGCGDSKYCLRRAYL